MWPVAKRIYLGKCFSDFAVDHDREFYRRYTGFVLIPAIDQRYTGFVLIQWRMYGWNSQSTLFKALSKPFFRSLKQVSMHSSPTRTLLSASGV